MIIRRQNDDVYDQIGIDKMFSIGMIGVEKTGLGIATNLIRRSVLLAGSCNSSVKNQTLKKLQAVLGSAVSKPRHPELFPGRPLRGWGSRRAAPSTTTPSSSTGRRCSRAWKVGTARSHSWGRNSSNPLWSTFFSYKPNHPHCPFRFIIKLYFPHHVTLKYCTLHCTSEFAVPENRLQRKKGCHS